MDKDPFKEYIKQSEPNKRDNRSMHISGRFAEVDIESAKEDIESGEGDIERVLMPFAKLPKINRRTRQTFTKSNGVKTQ